LSRRHGKGLSVHKVIEMFVATLRNILVEVQEETHTDRLLRLAKCAKDAKSNGGANLSLMTREERRKVLFGQ
jgi:hypothetical protein